VQARVTVIDDAIKEFMNANPNEGIKINLFNAKEELVLDRTAKPDELITYQSEQSKTSIFQRFFRRGVQALHAGARLSLRPARRQAGQGRPQVLQRVLQA